jgi:hypothetical protein
MPWNMFFSLLPPSFFTIFLASITFVSASFSRFLKFRNVQINAVSVCLLIQKVKILGRIYLRIGRMFMIT